ncbi:MAG: TAXI family TRAP transporter solute-binding subunit [Pseudomonadota bacterium]
MKLPARLGFGFVVLLLAKLASAAALETLHLHPPDTQQLDFAALSKILQEETGLRLVADPTNDTGDDPLDSVLDGSAELAIVENSREFEAGIRTVLPLYRGVVHLAVAQDLSLEALLAEGRALRVHVVHGSHAGKLVIDLLLQRAENQLLKYEFWTPGEDGSPDILIYVGPVNPANVDWMPESFELVSVGHFDTGGGEFYLEGISYLVPQFQPTRIPARTYTLPGNDRGIDALAVDMLLVAHRDTDADAVQDITRALIEQKARFAAAEPALFRWLSADFNDSNFAFPLHEGARRYFERDDPGFLERYAETLNFLTYLMALVITGIVALGRWRARRRKDRIDGFYLRVLEIRGEVAFADPSNTLAQLEAIEREAFDALVGERLAADDSFRIFTELVSGLRRELRDRIDERHAMTPPR